MFPVWITGSHSCKQSARQTKKENLFYPVNGCFAGLRAVFHFPCLTVRIEREKFSNSHGKKETPVFVPVLCCLSPLASCGALLGKKAEVRYGCLLLSLFFPTCASPSLTCCCLVMRLKRRVQVVASPVTLVVKQRFISQSWQQFSCLTLPAVPCKTFPHAAKQLRAVGQVHHHELNQEPSITWVTASVPYLSR